MGLKSLKQNFQVKRSFLVSLLKKNCDENNDRVLKVWDRFEMEKITDYDDLFLNYDILLLAGVFEKFRNSSLKNYGLFPSHYLSISALSWDAMLNMTKIEVELLLHADMYLLFEKYMRGGVSYISQRHRKANSQYLISYHPKQELKEFIKEIRKLAPYEIEIIKETWSNYQLKVADFYDISISNVKKLVPNFFDKRKYELGYENLKLHLRLGLNLKNTSCIIIQSGTMAKTIC